MIVNITEKGFYEKPQSREISSMRFTRREMTPRELSEYISNGYCYCNVFNKESFTIKEKTKSNFLFSNLVSVDIDHTTLPMDEALNKVNTTPTIAYETYSNGKDGLYSYRFIYALSNRVGISSIEPTINYFYSMVESELHISTDKRTRNPYQYFNGTYNKRVICNDNIIYNPSELHISPSEPSNAPSGITIPRIEKRGLERKYESPFTNDYFNMSKKDLLDRYSSDFINKEHSDLPLVDDDTPLIHFPSEYREIRRYWYQERNENETTTTHIRRIKDGMGRRHKLFLNGVIRRLIEPTLTFDNILFNLVYEMYHYIDNRDMTITNQILYSIAVNVFESDLNQYKELGRSKRKYMANPSYCTKHNLTKNTVAKMKIDYNEVGNLYDCTMSDEQNCYVMGLYGINIKPITLKKWRLKNNISIDKPKATKTVTKKPKIDYSIVDEVINMNLSIRKSVDVLKEKGITLSKTQFQRYKVSQN